MGTHFRHDSFLFSSAFRSFYTDGVFKTLTKPASDPFALCQDVAQAFDQARHAGITHPIVVGAIPFDVSQPSSLYIPQTCHFLSREAFKQKLGAAPQTSLGVVARHLHPEREAFLDMVKSAVHVIRQGELQKIVLSRMQSLEVEEPLNTIALLATLAEQNPNGYSFISLWRQTAVCLAPAPNCYYDKKRDQSGRRHLRAPRGVAPMNKRIEITANGCWHRVRIVTNINWS